MNYIDYVAIAPIVIMAVTAMISLILISIARNHAVIFGESLLGIAVSFIALLATPATAPRRTGIILVMDQYSMYFMALMLILSAVACILAYIYLRAFKDHKEELYVLIVISAIGGMVLASSNHFVSLFLGFEILSVTLYVMISFLRDSEFGLEAGIKYLVLTAAASAFLVLGMALIYAETGALDFDTLLDLMKNPQSFRSAYFLMGTGLIIVGIGFKMGVVPFHMWTPDIYQGAVSPVTAFIASVSKMAMVAFLLRYFMYIDLHAAPGLLFIIGVISLLSMLVGNLLAIIQQNLKRLLAYSSIAHLGYILVGIVALSGQSSEAVLYYITVYSFTIMGAFGLIAFISETGNENETIESYRGLFWRRPLAAGVFSVMLFSLAGIPLTAGFIGKYFIILSGLNKTLWILVVVLILSSVIGLYYYLRVIAVMVDSVDHKAKAATMPAFSFGKAMVLCAVSLFILFFGIYPGPLIALIRYVLQASAI